MPSMQNPTWYERAELTAPSRADDFFKWLDHDEYDETTGDVESPVGWVGLIEVTRDQIATYVASAGDPWLSERRNFGPGWYIVRIDSNGLVWGMAYDDEESALADYESANLTYLTWAEEEEMD